MNKKENDDVFAEEAFMIDLVARPLKNVNEIYRDNTIWTNNNGLKVLFELFSIVKDEAVETSMKVTELENRFDKVYTILLNTFISEFETNKDLEDIIVKNINKLRKYDFTPLLEEIKEMLLSLRNQKINFYETLLKEYKKRKEEYHRKLREYLKWQNDVKTGNINLT